MVGENHARQIFNKVRYRNLFSWTSVMMGNVYHGHADETVTLFRSMQMEQAQHDLATLITLFRQFVSLEV
ncbi:hypothetical protein ACFX2I_045223 [Malus domestica]